MKKISLASINSCVLLCFMFICVFFPGDPYHFKILLLLVLLALNAKMIAQRIGYPRYRPILIIGLLFPVVTMFQSWLLTNGSLSSVSGAYSPIIMLLMIPIIEYDLPFKRQLLGLLKLMAVSTLLIAAADMMGIVDVNASNVLRESFYKFDMGLMGKSTMYSSYYRIFFKTSPLLVILIDESISKKNYAWGAVAFLAMCFSGTRANVFSSIIIIGSRLLMLGKKNTRLRYLIAAFAFVGLILCLPRIFGSVLAQMSTQGAVESDAVRSNELYAYAEVFSNPFNLICGSGFGSQYYSYGRNTLVTTSELSYLELIRCVGFPLAVVFIAFVAAPFFSRRINKYTKIAYACYLLIAATNPFLFSSTGMIMYIYLYREICGLCVTNEYTHLFEVRTIQEEAMC